MNVNEKKILIFLLCFGFLTMSFMLVKNTGVDNIVPFKTSQLWPLRYNKKSTHNTELSKYDVTVVTLYIPLGSFQKGEGGYYYTNDKYRGWMEIFGWLTNKLVAFFTDEETVEFFKKIRSHHPPDKNVIIKLDTSELNAFKDYEKVQRIFSDDSYPKHHPNTVNANYSVIMNAKYDVLQMAMDLGHVTTPYIAWLDIGCFRHFLDSESSRPKNNSFTLEAPLDFDETKIAFSEVGSRDFHLNLSPWDYIRNNHVWVAGSFTIGRTDVVKKFIQAYKKAVQKLLDQNMASTDQQVIGAMYSPQMIQEQPVDIETYTCWDGQYGLYSSANQYFCLAYICKEAAEIRRMNRTGSNAV